MNDFLAVLISFMFVFAALGAAELLRKTLKLNAEFTRKVAHIGVGMGSWGTVALFQNKWFAIIPPAAFIFINYLSYRRGLFLAMESNDRRNLGTVYFPIAFVAIILLLWDSMRAMIPLLLMPMTWGDALAAVIGKRFGRHPYTVFGATRSFEGSATMFIVTVISVILSALVIGPQLSAQVIALALLCATLCAIAEALSPWGLDNLIVPAAAVLAWLFWLVLQPAHF